MNLDYLLSRIDPSQVRQLDVQFSKFLSELETESTDIGVAGFLVSSELGKGNVCLDFMAFNEHLSSQELQSVLSSIKTSPLVHLVTESIEITESIETPLVLKGSCLYLQRYYKYENGLDHEIRSRLQPMPWDVDRQSDLLQSLFDVSPEQSEINWQAVAAYTAAQNKFSVISGGPGTGKTTTVIRLLALIIQQYQSAYKRSPIIKLAAPTGKAAMRLTESIVGAKQSLKVDLTIKDAIPQKAETLHRLLQRNLNGDFKYNQHNRLHLDVLIVDEASMIDLPLMSKLISAMPEHGQIILLGDKDQLASVEAGSVLADICDNETQHGYSSGFTEKLKSMVGGDYTDYIEKEGAVIRDHICQLRKSYRFDENSGIGHLARASNAGDYEAWHTALNPDSHESFSDIAFHELTDEAYKAVISEATEDISKNIKQINQQGMSDTQALEIHKAYGRYQILCALKEGPLGVSGINEEIEKLLKHKGAITGESQWYVGRPVIILENDYGLNLYNGDIGILLPQMTESGEAKLKATFIGADEKVRWVQPSRLPKHDTVYAMTVHKSQGSEFEHCTFILPNYAVPILTKELIYTGITRAKKTLTLLADNRVLKSALKKKVQRSSGLGQLLWRSQSRAVTSDEHKNVDVTEPLNESTEAEIKVLKESNEKQHLDSSQLPDDESQFSLF